MLLAEGRAIAAGDLRLGETPTAGGGTRPRAGREDSADRHPARGHRAARADRGAEDVELGAEGRGGAAVDQPARHELQDQDARHRVPARSAWFAPGARRSTWTTSRTAGESSSSPRSRRARSPASRSRCRCAGTRWRPGSTRVSSPRSMPRRRMERLGVGPVRRCASARHRSSVTACSHASKVISKARWPRLSDLPGLGPGRRAPGTAPVERRRATRSVAPEHDQRHPPGPHVHLDLAGAAAGQHGEPVRRPAGTRKRASWNSAGSDIQERRSGWLA